VIRKIYILDLGGKRMGRIKSALVKRTAFKLMKDAEGFSGEFDNDKKMLGNTMPSKKLRNKILKYKYGQSI